MFTQSLTGGCSHETFLKNSATFTPRRVFSRRLVKNLNKISVFKKNFKSSSKVRLQLLRSSDSVFRLFFVYFCIKSLSRSSQRSVFKLKIFKKKSHFHLCVWPHPPRRGSDCKGRERVETSAEPSSRQVATFLSRAPTGEFTPVPAAVLGGLQGRRRGDNFRLTSQDAVQHVAIVTEWQPSRRGRSDRKCS